MSLYLFDIDGTLAHSFLRDGSPRHEYDRVEILPGRLERLRQLREQGHDVAMVTNQGGVAFGYQTEVQVNAKMFAICKALEFPARIRPGDPLAQEAYVTMTGPVDEVPPATLKPAVYLSLHHPKATVAEWLTPPDMASWRKPGGGMIEQAMRDYRVSPEMTSFIGDMDSDREAALAAGVHYFDVGEFFD